MLRALTEFDHEAREIRSFRAKQRQKSLFDEANKAFVTIANQFSELTSNQDSVREIVSGYA